MVRLSRVRSELEALAPLHESGRWRSEPAPQGLSLQELARLAPELTGAVAAPVGPPSDLYGVGVTLFEELAGRPPLAAATLAELLQAQSRAPVPALEEAPAGLDMLAARLLARDPADRPPTGGAVLADLRRWEADPEGFVPGLEDVRPCLAAPALVGRREPLARALARLQGGGLLAVVAPAGLGKSRLVEEVLRHAFSRGHLILRCRARASAARLPLLALEELGQALLSQADGSLGDRLRRELQAWGPVAAAALPVLEPLLGPPARSGPDSAGAARTRAALARLVRALGTPERPAVVVLEDLQWSPREVLDVLQEAADAPHTLLLLNAREPLPLEAPTLELPPLARSEIEALVRSMTGRLPGRPLRMVTSLAQGSPYLAVQAIRSMVARGALEPGPRGWTFHPAAMPIAAAPEAAVALLRGRLDGLGAERLRTLSLAALLGREFEEPLLLRIAPDAPAHLEAARQAGLVARIEAGRWTFLHDRLREDVLARLEPAEKAALHAAVAQQLEPGRVHDLAFHLYEAGDPEAARPYAEEAARQALRQDAHDTAEYYFELALASRPEDPALLEGLGDARRLAGRFRPSEEAYGRALAGLTAKRDRARVLGSMAHAGFQVGDLVRAGDRLCEAVELLGHRIPKGRAARLAAVASESLRLALVRPGPRPELTADERLAARLLDLGTYIFSYLDGYGLVWFNLRALNLAERAAPSTELGLAVATHAAATLFVPALATRARRIARRAIEIHRSHSGEFELAAAEARAGTVFLYTGDPAHAVELGTRALPVLERAGVHYDAHMTSYNLALGLHLLGRYGEARDLARRTCERAAALGDALCAALCLRTLGLAEILAPEWLARLEALGDTRDMAMMREEVGGLAALQAGRLEEAARRLASAAAEAQRLMVIPNRLNSLLFLAQAWRRLGESTGSEAAWRAARKAAREALALARHPYRTYVPRAARESAMLAAARGHRSRARALLEESLAAARGMALVYEEALTRIALGRLEGDPEGERLGRALLGGLDGAWEAPPWPAPASVPSLADRLEGVLTWGRALASSLTEGEVLETARRAAEALLRADCRRLPPFAREARPAPVEPLETDTRSALVIPLSAGGRRVADLYLRHRDVPDFFGADELRVASYLESLASAALENARRLDQVARIQETERRLLAAEVHDVISQPLVGLQYRISSVASRIGGEVAGELDQAADRLRRTLDDVRGLIFQMDAPGLDEMRLGAALREALSETAAGLPLRADLGDGLDEVRGLAALFAYRMILEGLANVRRHASARRVRLRVRVSGGELRAALADDGVGFDPQGVDEARFGLRILRDRAELLGGRLRVRSAPGRGTALAFRLPVRAP